MADVPHELSAQIGDGGEDATGDDVALDPGEPQFDLVEPGRVSRREVQPTWYGHSSFRIEAGAAKILIDPFLSDNPSWDKGWIGSHAGEDSTRGGGR